MDLHIRGEEAEQLAAQLASHTGESVDVAVTEALRERLTRIAPERTIEERIASIRAIQDRVAAAYAESGKRPLTCDEWNEENYDEWGVPR